MLVGYRVLVGYGVEVAALQTQSESYGQVELTQRLVPEIFMQVRPDSQVEEEEQVDWQPVTWVGVGVGVPLGWPVEVGVGVCVGVLVGVFVGVLVAVGVGVGDGRQQVEYDGLTTQVLW